MESTWWTQPEDLDSEQKKVVSLGRKQDHLVIGPPGSGKTNLLILRASYLHSAGQKNIVVLTFGRVLREFLAAGSNNYNFDAGKVQTYVRWAKTILSENDMDVGEIDDFKALRTQLGKSLSILADKALPENVYDCILIDEVQDYSLEELSILRKFARNIFAVGDSRQQIYNEANSQEDLKKNFKNVSELTHHYRNGLKICRVADGVRNILDEPNGLEASSNYDEKKYPSAAKPSPAKSLHEQVLAAATEIETQLRAYPGAFIGVMCPRRKEDLQAVWKAIQTTPIADKCQLQEYEQGYAPFSADRKVLVTSIHGAKGLEFRAAHLVGMEKVTKFRRQRNMTFTAATRAKTTLTVHYTGSIPGYLEAGLAAASAKKPALPKVEELFPGAKK